MHYLESGQGDPVICIHGWPETSHEWTRIAPLLQNDMRLLAPDTRGHGRTAAPESGYDRAQLARDIVEFMDALEIDKCPIVAHDWGGIIAVKLALDHGERVERLCLMDTICTGWPMFVQYYYWFMDGNRAETFFAEYSQEFISSIIGGRHTSLPPPPDCPVEFQSQSMITPKVWASDEDLKAYWLPYESGHDGRVSCAYYRNLAFHRVVEDPSAVNGERYEPVTQEAMGRMWSEQNIPFEYLDFAPEDRYKTYAGETLWVYGSYLLDATGAQLNDTGIPVGDPSFDSFSRHFPKLQARSINEGHFFLESAPEESSDIIRGFIQG